MFCNTDNAIALTNRQHVIKRGKTWNIYKLLRDNLRKKHFYFMNVKSNKFIAFFLYFRRFRGLFGCHTCKKGEGGNDTFSSCKNFRGGECSTLSLLHKISSLRPALIRILYVHSMVEKTVPHVINRGLGRRQQLSTYACHDQWSKSRAYSDADNTLGTTTAIKKKKNSNPRDCK